MIIPLRPEVRARLALTRERIALVLEDCAPELRAYINHLLRRRSANVMREAGEDYLPLVHVRLYAYASRAAMQEEVRLALRLPPGIAYGLLEILGLHPKQVYVTSFISYERRKIWLDAHVPPQQGTTSVPLCCPNAARALVLKPVPLLAMDLRPQYCSAVESHMLLLEVELTTLNFLVGDMVCPHRGKRPTPLEQAWSEDFIRCTAFKIVKQLVIDTLRRPPHGTAA